jgi:hypothetical protein
MVGTALLSPTTGIQRSYYLPDRVSHERKGPDVFGLSQICLTSHADRLTIGGRKTIEELNLMLVGPRI